MNAYKGLFHVLLLCLSSTASYLVQQRNFVKHDSENVNIVDNLQFQVNADSALQCAAICKRTPWCRTLSVTSPPSAATVTCRGHTSLVENSTVITSPWTSLWTTESGRGCLGSGWLAGLLTGWLVY